MVCEKFIKPDFGNDFLSIARIARKITKLNWLQWSTAEKNGEIGCSVVFYPSAIISSKPGTLAPPRVPLRCLESLACVQLL